MMQPFHLCSLDSDGVDIDKELEEELNQKNSSSSSDNFIFITHN